MPLVPVHIEQFGGLNLVDDPAEVGLAAALDLLNVDFDRRGRIHTRNGYTKLNGTTSGTTLVSLTPWDLQFWAIAQGIDNKLYVYPTATGALAHTSSAYTGIVTHGVPFGTGTTAYMYFPQDTASGVIRLTGAGAFSQPAGMPSARFLAVQPNDNRLVAAYTSNGVSRVEFSDAGAAETWGANNYVLLTPNDGESVCSPVAWQGMTFVFKQTKFFVFYGNSVDGTGNPVFNYRAVTGGDGAIASIYPTAVAAPDGVYFIGQEGIFRTTGGPAVKVSGPIDPLFTGAPAPFSPITPPLVLTGDVDANGRSFGGCCYRQGHVYFLVRNANGTYLLVYGIEGGRWMVWQTADSVQSAAALPFSQAPDQLGLVGGGFVYTQGLTDTADNGSSISSRYRSGFGDLGYPGQEKVVREAEVTGQGTVQLGWSRDFGSITTSSLDNVTMGTAPATDRGYHRKSQDGELLGWRASSVSGGAWQINRLTAFLRDVRPPAENTG